MKKGEHITKRRKELGFSSVAELAEKVGVKQQSAFQWEKGGGIRGRNRDKLAEVLQVSTYWIDDGWKDNFHDLESPQNIEKLQTTISPKDELIGMRIIEERGRLGFSQQELADKIQIDVSNLRDYELAKVTIPANFISSLDLYNLDIQYILTGRRSEPKDKTNIGNTNIINTMERNMIQGNVNQINGR